MNNTNSLRVLIEYMSEISLNNTITGTNQWITFKLIYYFYFHGFITNCKVKRWHICGFATKYNELRL